MKTEKQIMERINWYRKRIDEILKMDREEWDEFIIDDLELYRCIRMELLWVLSEKKYPVLDDYYNKVEKEITNYKSQ